MREKELRLALVYFGGVSLAISIHGISKEILKLVRASSALHAIDSHAARETASFFDHADSADPEYDTEAIYFELLREIRAQETATPCAWLSTSSPARRPAASTGRCWRGR